MADDEPAPRRNSARGWGRAALAVVWCLLGPAAAAQELDRARPVPDRLAADRSGVAPIDSGDAFTPARPRAPSFVDDEGFDPSQFPDRPAPTPSGPPPRSTRLRWEGDARVGAGSDSNVFRAERGLAAEGFAEAAAEAELLVKLPGGGELFVEASGETRHHVRRPRADERFAASFLEFFQPVASWLEVGAQNVLEGALLNLLDDDGDLLPRGRFGSFDEEVRGFTVVRPAWSLDDGASRILAAEFGGGWRLKNYEENAGVDSLDYTELRGDTSLRIKLSRRPRSRIKLRYRYRRRDYRELRARTRAGVAEPTAPRLALDRHQVTLTWFQDVALPGSEQSGRLVLSVGGVYNHDTYQGDRSYRELAASARVEWWVVPAWTRLDVIGRALGRDFLVRRTSSGGGRLRHRLLVGTIGLRQRLVELGRRSAPISREGGFDLALYVRATFTLWRSADVGEDYERTVVAGGLELSW